MPLVSILIPCFNAAPWLRETLASALSQSWPQKEIILVDDGSTDNSLSIAREYELKGIRVLSQYNQGASVARNTALLSCKGEYIQYLDADDLLATDKISRQMRLAQQVGPDYALCSTWSRFKKDITDADFPPQLLCKDATPVDWMVTKLEHNAMMHPAAWLISRALIEKAGPWDIARSPDDDGEYFTRVVLSSRGVRFCPEAVSYYRSGLPHSLSRSKTDAAWSAVFTSLEQTTNRLCAAEDSPLTRHACATAFQRFIYDAYPRAKVCRSRATAQVVRLGGSDLRPEHGPRFRFLSTFFGWRLTKRLRLLARSS